MMKKVLYAFLAACVLAGCTTSSPVEPELKAQILCMTADATSITPSSAELNGTAAIQNASSKNAEAYFYYSTDESDAPFWTRVSAGKIAGTGGDFSCELNDLEPSSTYYYVAAVSIDGQEVVGNVKSFTTEPELKAQILCVTADATSITHSSVELNGTASIRNASSESAESYFYYSANESDAETVKAIGTKVPAGKIAGTGGDFSCVLNDLEPSSTYYYVASVAIDEQESLGALRSFTTKAAPLTMTGAVDNISVTSATLYGYANLPSDMTGEVKIGIIFSTDAEPTFQNSEKLSANELDGNNRYACKATALTSCTKYYYRSYLTRGELNYYGEVKSFTTEDVTVSLTTEDATEILCTKATLSGKLTVESIEELSKSVYFKYGTDSETLKTDGKTVSASLDGDSFSYSLTGLTLGMTYYYVAYANVAGRETYGEVKSFATADFTVSLTTEDATEILCTKATLNGKITVESIEELSKSVYFIYGTDAETLKTGGKWRYASLDGDSFCYTLTGLAPNTTYYYVAYVNGEVRYGDVTYYSEDYEYYGEVKSFTTLDYQIPEPVDLGLSVKWANFNVGAMCPEDYGAYFAWGETEPKRYCSWDTYKWCNGSEDTLTKYNTDSDFGAVDNKTILDPEDDAATVNLGPEWRMPTEKEFQELIDNCEWIWTTYNGVHGYKVVSKVSGYEGAYIFLPATGYSLDDVGLNGYYWSSSLYGSWSASYLHFDDNSDVYTAYRSRDYCQSVRPVTK